MNRIKVSVIGQNPIFLSELGRWDISYGLIDMQNFTTALQDQERLQKDLKILITGLRITLGSLIGLFALIGGIAFISLF